MELFKKRYYNPQLLGQLLTSKPTGSVIEFNEEYADWAKVPDSMLSVNTKPHFYLNALKASIQLVVKNGNPLDIAIFRAANAEATHLKLQQTARAERAERYSDNNNNKRKRKPYYSHYPGERHGFKRLNNETEYENSSPEAAIATTPKRWALVLDATLGNNGQKTVLRRGIPNERQIQCTLYSNRYRT